MNLARSADTVEVEEIAATVVRIVADLLEIDAEGLERDKPFPEMGVDSVHIVGLSAELEDCFGVTLDPEIAYQYDTVDKISDHLGVLLTSGAEKRP